MPELFQFDLIEAEEKNQSSLETKFSQQREKWTQQVTFLSSKLKTLGEIATLMTTLYTERQQAVEYYHYLLSLMIKLNKEYNAKYAERQDYYTNKVQVRYPNESVKHNRIMVDLADLVDKRSTIENHSKFMNQTISSIDAIIYAVPKRIEVEQIVRGK